MFVGNNSLFAHEIPAVFIFPFFAEKENLIIYNCCRLCLISLGIILEFYQALTVARSLTSYLFAMSFAHLPALAKRITIRELDGWVRASALKCTSHIAPALNPELRKVTAETRGLYPCFRFTD